MCTLTGNYKNEMYSPTKGIAPLPIYKQHKYWYVFVSSHGREYNHQCFRRTALNLFDVSPLGAKDFFCWYMYKVILQTYNIFSWLRLSAWVRERWMKYQHNPVFESACVPKNPLSKNKCTAKNGMTSPNTPVILYGKLNRKQKTYSKKKKTIGQPTDIICSNFYLPTGI